MADGPAGLRGRLAGHGDDLHDLLGGEGSGPARSGRVVEGGLDHVEQVPFADSVGLGGGEPVFGVEPTVTPEADGNAGESLVLGDLLQARVIGQREQDADTADKAD